MKREGKAGNLSTYTYYLLEKVSCQIALQKGANLNTPILEINMLKRKDFASPSVRWVDCLLLTFVKEF